MYPTAWRSAIPFRSLRGLAVCTIVLWLCIGGAVSGCRNSDGADRASRPTHINPADKHLAHYYHLVGQLDSVTIRLDLQEELGLYADAERYFRGFYHYERYGGPISVYGTLDASGNLKLTEQGAAEGEPHYFVGKWDDKGIYTGHWHHGNGKNKYAFQLEARMEASVPFTKYVYMDSLVAFADWQVSPQLYYSAEWLEVAEGSQMDADTRQFIHQQMMAGLLDTLLTKPTKDIMPLLVNRRDFLYADFLDNMTFMRTTRLLDSTTTNPADFLSVSYTYNTLVQVYYNTRDLLSLGFTDYYYTGGAHGMYTTRVATYDLKQRRPLTPDDILLPGYQKAVSQALGQAVRTKYNLPESSPLTAVLFENRIAPNGNFGLTHKGIFFVYAPYEIAPYSEGELTLFVAFNNIKEFVRPEWLPTPQVMRQQ